MADPDSSNIDCFDPLTFFRAIGAGQPGRLPLPKLASPADVRSQATDRSTSIFQSWNMLRSILDRHESTIQKRWRKKRQEQRRQILLKAWGGSMAPTHRPDFEAFRKETEAQRVAGTKFREAFMWPYINQEDLVQPKTLLLLLNARGRHGPAAFAANDCEAMHLGYTSKAIVPVFLSQHVMLFRNGTDPESYGRLLNWNDHPDAFTWVKTHREHQPGDGLLILEVQDRLLSFLVNCAKQILSDIPKDQLLSGPVQREPPSVSETSNGFASLPILASEAPYRVPAQLDLGALESLLAAKRDEAADHFWALREDPGYFNSVLHDVAEHRQEMLKDSNGQAHPIFRRHREDVLWGRVLGSEISSALLQFEMWSELHRQSTKLKAMQSTLSSKIKPEDDLPAEYLHALLKFQYWLIQSAKSPTNMLRVAVVASPPWRPYFERVPVSDPTTTENVTQQKHSVKLDKEQQNFFWLLRTLWDGGKPLYPVGITNILDELQRALEASASLKSMLTSYTASIVADLSIICECLRQIDLYQPWANTFEDAMIDAGDKIEEGFAQRVRTWHRTIDALRENEKLIVRLGAPNEVDFRYPIDKRRTKENVAAMRLAEANLDRFWKKVDEIMHYKTGDMNRTTVQTLLTEPRALRRTPEWIESSKPDAPQRKDSETCDILSKPLSELYLDLQQRTEKTIQKENFKAASRTRAKEKRRGQPNDTKLQLEEHVTDVNPVDLQSTFKVDSRALKVFKTLFFAQSPTALPGEVAWTDFLHAMSSMGFQFRKLHGSAWQFTPIKPEVERGIQIHEPHPTGKIPYLVARRHGRRLNRAYGWHAGTFELAGIK